MANFDSILVDSELRDQVWSMQRTNPKLTGNIKWVIADQDLYLESINASQYLQSVRFKAHKVNISVTLPRAVKTFISESNNLNEWYTVSQQSLLQAESPAEQRKNLYEWGAYYDSSSPLIKKRFFAPIWSTGVLPDNFVIFKIKNQSYTDIKQILIDGQLVQSYDLKNSIYGKFIQSYLADNNFKSESLQADFSTGLSYYGWSLNDANWTTAKETVMTDYLANERMILEMNNIITNGWERNQLIHPSLLNLEFCFQDNSVDSGFSQYVGFYCNLIDLTDLQATNLSSNPESIVLSTNNISTVRQFSRLPEYLQITDSVTGYSSTNLAAQISTTWSWIPEKNSELVITYNTTVVYKFSFGVYSSIKEAQLAFLNDFNNASFVNVSLRAFFNQQNQIIIETGQISQVLEKLQISTPSSIKSSKTFRGVFSTDLLISKDIEENFIIYQNITYPILEKFRYNNLFVIRLNQNLKITTATILQLAIIKKSSLSIASLINHKDFDFSTDRSSHKDPIDTDIQAYQSYLISEVNKDSYVGSWDSNIESLLSYKQRIRDSINSYFSTLEIDKNLLIKDLDPITLEASTTIPNEYDRLQENQNLSTKDLNRLDNFICKWGHAHGRDTYSRPYELNVNLAFRHDNFAPSYTKSSRDLRVHTHSWYVLAAGCPSYLTDVRKRLGYANSKIILSDLFDTDNDGYEKLKHQVNESTEQCWSYLRKREGTQNTYYTFFRGAEIEFIGSYSGYRFCALLFSEELFSSTKPSDYIDLIENLQFKTLTLAIHFYIPDPILTSLESGVPYFVDRSLLYFSNEILSTKNIIKSFGISTISLDLFNTTLPKLFLGSPVGTDWKHMYMGQMYYCIYKGSSTRWSENFTGLLDIGDNLTWKLLDGDTIITEFTATNIFEITSDYIWVSDIKMTLNRNTPSVIRSLDTDLTNYSGEPELVTKDNDWYISKAISYYNCSYDVILKAKGNAKRYDSVSFANIANIINNYPLDYFYITQDSMINSEKSIKVYAPQNLVILNSLKSVNAELQQLSTNFLFPIYRYKGLYSPIFRTVYKSSDLINQSIKYLNSTISTIFTDLRYLKKWAIQELTNQVDLEDRNYLLNLFDDNLKQYITETTYQNKSTYANRIAIKSWISSLFNYRQSFTLISNSANFNLRELLQSELLGIITTNEIASQTEDQAIRLNLLSTYQKNSSNLSLLTQDERISIFTTFYQDTFLKQYTITNIIDQAGKQVQYQQIDSENYVLQADYGQIILSAS